MMTLKTELHNMLLDAAEQIFRHYDFPSSPHTGPLVSTWPEDVWENLESVGLASAMLSEDMGGAGLSASEAFPMLRLVGYYGIPLPVAETMIARWLAELAGFPHSVGPLSIAPVRETDTLYASFTRDGWHVSGTVHRVPWASKTSSIIAIAISERGPLLVSLEASGARTVISRNLAGELRETLHFEGNPVLCAEKSPISKEHLLAMGAVARSVQMAGACTRAWELSIEYANLRVQFGRPIAKFQIIQQNIAVQAAEVAAAIAAADMGIEALDKKLPLIGVATAKIRTGEAAGKVAAVAHQIFGAIGFTEEHSLHLSTRRLLAWRDEFGSEAEWAQRLGAQSITWGCESLWKVMTA